jgi:3-deoxy-D-manno-octulosonate 8-phosphate phosphatase (KDO 8-P phosphatase)
MSRIDYDLTRIRAFVFDVDGVLSPNCVPIDANGVPSRMANVKDGYALQLAVKHGYKMSIITGADTREVRLRYELLGIKDIFQKAAYKINYLRQWMADQNLQPDEVAYFGDDLPDVQCLQEVGLAVVPADASDDAKEVAKYISPCQGGGGVARDVIEQVMRAQGQWLHDDTAYGW